MSSHLKLQNNLFVKYIVSSKNVKKEKMFLSSEPLHDDFFKILFSGNQVSHNTFLCVEFNDHWPNSLEREESYRNHRSGCTRVSLNIYAPPMAEQF